MMLPPAVVVHGLAMARQALEPGLPLTFLSAPGAGIYAGVGVVAGGDRSCRERR